MKVGDTVKYKEACSKDVTGEVTRVKGRKWLCVEWSDNINLPEHVDDLTVLKK